jgi:hypothetical protein
MLRVSWNSPSQRGSQHGEVTPEQIFPEPDVALQHHRLIIKWVGLIGYLAIKAE